jgi:hypothetical protein
MEYKYKWVEMENLLERIRIQVSNLEPSFLEKLLVGAGSA